MRTIQSIRGISVGTTLAALGFAATVCPAQDCGPTPYGYDNRVVLFACGKAKTPELRVIVLDDAAPLKVTGRATSSATRSFDAAANYGNFLLLLTWTRLEVYDLSKPAQPKLVASFDLKERERLAFSRFEKTAENRFLVLSPAGATELTGPTPDWAIRDVQLTPEMRKRATQPPPESRFTINDGSAIPVRETEQFRYELVWKAQTRTGQVVESQLLRKTDKRTHQTVSELVLGARMETID